MKTAKRRKVSKAKRSVRASGIDIRSCLSPKEQADLSPEEEAAINAEVEAGIDDYAHAWGNALLVDMGFPPTFPTPKKRKPSATVRGTNRPATNRRTR